MARGAGSVAPTWAGAVDAMTNTVNPEMATVSGTGAGTAGTSPMDAHARDTHPADALPARAPLAAHAGGGTDNLVEGLEGALARAAAYVRRARRTDGSWVGELSSSALATAMAIVALQLVGAGRHARAIEAGRRWLVRTQLPDGGWGDATTDASNINATSLAIAALVYTGSEVAPPARVDGEGTVEGINDGHAEAAVPEGPALRHARARLERFGGYAAVGDPTRCTLSGPCRTVSALAGIMDWRRIKRLRPEVILIPRRLRRTISTTFPAYLSISLLHCAMAPRVLDRLPTFRWARERALAWLARAQGPNGSFEESAFLTAVIVACLTAAGAGDLPWLGPAVAFIAASQRPDGGFPIDRDLETFDTDLTVLALREAGVEIPEAATTRDWLLARQTAETCFPTGARPGGWAWAMPAGWPDADDTSYTLLALRALGTPAAAPALERGVRWLEWLQNRDGSWSTFVRDSGMPMDHDCPYIVGHVLCALQACGALARRPRVRERALAYLGRAQRYDGSFASVWFREATAGTASVLEALADLGLARSGMAERARAHLLRAQNDDGGWAGLRGEASTAEETAWAVLALLRAPADDPAADRVARATRRGVRWLIDRQRPDGTWSEAPIGLYYSAMWYADSYYAISLPLRALARAQRAFPREGAQGTPGERGAPGEPPAQREHGARLGASHAS